MFPNNSPMLGMSGMNSALMGGVSPYQANNNYQTQQQDPTQALLAQLSAQGATAGGGTDGTSQLASALTADPLTTATSYVQPMAVPANPLTTTAPAASTTAAATTTPAASSSGTSLNSILSALGITPSGASTASTAAAPASTTGGSGALTSILSALGI